MVIKQVIPVDSSYKTQMVEGGLGDLVTQVEVNNNLPGEITDLTRNNLSRRRRDRSF